MTNRTVFAVTALALVASSAAAANAQCAPATQHLINERKFDEARSQIQSTLSRTPNDDQALHCLGMVSMELNRPREAAGYFEKAVKLNDKSSLHHLWLGNALGDGADSTSKIKLPFLARRIKSEFQLAVDLDPTSVDARHGLIQFYLQAPGVMGGSVDKAKEQAREIVKLNTIRGHLEMAAIYEKEKKTPEVEKEYLAAEREAPDSVAAPLNLALFYTGQQRWADAFAVYDRVLKKFPADVGVHYQIGRAAAMSGEQLDRGEKELKIWLAAPPKNATAANIANGHWRLGMIYEKQAKKDLARAEYNAALTLDPKNENAKKSLAGMK